VRGVAEQRGVNPEPDSVRYNGPVAVRAIGRYQVVRLLGTGGFATVYLARDDRLDADVAIKVLAENWCNDEEISRRFLEEAKLLRRCDDDRVVRVHTIETLEDGRPYFVMDYADAGTLADRMFAAVDERRPFALREAVGMACEMADCLTVVHDCGIVHRDLKPSNVLFRTARSGERMLLGDFGLARQMVAASGKTILAGTPEYIAPEQADRALAATVDQRADVYAAAVILYELLTGAVPFTFASLEQVAAARARPPDLAATRADVPPELAAVVTRGMAPDRDERFASGRAWVAALREVLAGLPVEPGIVYTGGFVPPAPSAGGFAPPAPAAGATPAVPPAPTPVGAAALAGAIGAGAALVGAVSADAAPAVRTSPVPPGREPAGLPVADAAPGAAPTHPGGPGAPTFPAGGAPAGGGPPTPPGGGPVAPASAAAPTGPARHKPLWPLFAGILAALALIAAIAVLAGRTNGNGSSAAPPAATLPSTPASTPTATTPSTTPASTVGSSPAVVPTGPAAWFAAASGPTCRPSSASERPSGVSSAVTCVYPGIVAVFGQTASSTAASEVLLRGRLRRANSSITAWGQGDALSYGSTTAPALLWDYHGEPYVGFALSNNRDTLLSWWVATGRVVRAGL